jgi:hypothetical protein
MTAEVQFDEGVRSREVSFQGNPEKVVQNFLKKGKQARARCCPELQSGNLRSPSLVSDFGCFENELHGDKPCKPSLHDAFQPAAGPNEAIATKLVHNIRNPDCVPCVNQQLSRASESEKTKVGPIH